MCGIEILDMIIRYFQQQRKHTKCSGVCGLHFLATLDCLSEVLESVVFVQRFLFDYVIFTFLLYRKTENMGTAHLYEDSGLAQKALLCMCLYGDIQQCSTQLPPCCTKSFDVQNKTFVIGSGISQCSHRNLAKVAFSSEYKPYHFYPLLSEKNHMVNSVCSRPKIFYSLPSLKKNSRSMSCVMLHMQVNSLIKEKLLQFQSNKSNIIFLLTDCIFLIHSAD